MNSKFNEKRKYHRHHIVIPVEILISGLENPFSGEIIDLSMGGAFIKANAPINIGDSISIEIKLPEAHLLSGKVIDNERWLSKNAPNNLKNRSIVKWSRGSSLKGFGIEFTSMTREELELIQKLLEYEAPLKKE